MDEKKRGIYESQSQKLRTELKQWENQWAKTNGGKKPAREDIKQNTDIAQKYKQYNNVRDILAGKIPPSSPTTKSNPKRKAGHELEAAAHTPSKCSRTTETPSKPHYTNILDDPNTTPSLNRLLFSPTAPTSIGPTPQRDGRVLGLFDLLSSTPSRSDVLETPSKNRAQIINTPSHEAGKNSKGEGFFTPAHKRHKDAQATPLRMGKNPLDKTPSSLGSSASKLSFSTPAFLRRDGGGRQTKNLPSLEENEGEWKVEPLRLPRKPFGRSLSSVIADLRRMEDEAADEDLDVLREIEGGSLNKPSALLGKDIPKTPNGQLEVKDSQARRPILLGGFDDEGLYDSLDEERPRDRNLRVLKKKGQKRTSRLVNMRPTRTRRRVEQEGDDDVVPDTQVVSNGGTAADGALVESLDFDGEDRKSDAEYRTKRGPPKKTEKEKETAGNNKGEGAIRKVVRKVKATAHQNFKRLKLRNNGAKGGPGHNSRFRRRR